jgi:hypothetical protein
MEYRMSPNEAEPSESASVRRNASRPVRPDGKSFGWSNPPRPAHLDPSRDPLAQLEWLDDLMFAAIDGDPVALDCAAEAWKKTREQLGDPALEETRLQYLRHAQTVWHALRREPNHPPHKIFAAIEIISLLAARAH